MIDKILKEIKGLFKVQDKVKFLKQNIPYLAFFYIGNIFSHHVRAYIGGDIIDKIFQGILEINTMSFLPSIYFVDILTGIGVAAIIKFIIYTKGKNAKKFRQGKEYGSARWGNKKDIEPYMDEKFQNNILLTQTERLTMNGRPTNPKYARNKNVLVIGGSGSGKTRFFVKPNLMQMHSSYCVTDPKGTIVLECGKMLEDNGYEIKILNTINFKKSMKYNPFAYLRSEKDILKLVQTIIANTKGEGEKAGEDFWVKAEKLYYTALIGYIFYEAYMANDTINLLHEDFDYMIEDLREQGQIKDLPYVQEEKDDLVNIVGNVVGRVDIIERENKNGEAFKVANFSVVSKDDEGNKVYHNCSAYGEKSDIPKDFKQGDFVKLFGQLRTSIDDNGKEHSNVRILSSKLLKVKEQMKGQDKSQEIAKLKSKIEEREKDLFYADSWEQAGQIRADIEKMKAKLNTLTGSEKGKENDKKSILGAIKEYQAEDKQKPKESKEKPKETER